MRKFFMLSVLGSMFVSSLLAQTHSVQLVKSKLMWENSVHSRDIKVDYKGAVNYCKNIKTDTFQDWRLPTLLELSSIVDYTKAHPAIKKEFTLVNETKMYWSNTPYVDESNSFWGIKFKDGSTKNASSNYDRYVRCVRETVEAKKAPISKEPKVVKIIK